MSSSIQEISDGPKYLSLFQSRICLIQETLSEAAGIQINFMLIINIILLSLDCLDNNCLLRAREKSQIYSFTIKKKSNSILISSENYQNLQKVNKYSQNEG